MNFEEKIFEVTNHSFNSLCIEVFNFQYQNNTIYQQYCNAIGILPKNIATIEQIPFFPITFFKTHQVKTTSFIEQGIFESSGTTQTINSKHFIKDTELYKRSFTNNFTQFYGPAKEWCIIGLLPSYLEKGNSSLVTMVGDLITQTNNKNSGFYLYDTEKLYNILIENEVKKQPTLLIGVTYALLDFAEKYKMNLRYTIVMETGGMKGRREEISRQEIHTILQKELGVTHIVSSVIEHHAVYHTIEKICTQNSIEISYVKLDEKGNVDLASLEFILQQPGKKLVSLMHANNEIGTLLPLSTVSKLCKKYGAYLHSDTVQTIGHIPIDLSELEIDFITCAGHKLHGPKGVGFLYVNKRNKIASFIHGGSQERGLRGGTENIHGIAGLAKAIDLAVVHINDHAATIQSIKSYMIDRLNQEIKDVFYHGEIEEGKSLYTVLNVSFPKIDKSEMLLFTLDMKGIACSGGSACTSGANQGSHVLRGIEANTTRPNVRFSFSRFTTIAEIDYTINELKSIFQ